MRCPHSPIRMVRLAAAVQPLGEDDLEQLLTEGLATGMEAWAACRRARSSTKSHLSQSQSQPLSKPR
jgi:hypothetical protein